MEIKITFINNHFPFHGKEDTATLGRDDTITFTKGDIEVYHQPEEYVIHNLSLQKGNLKRVEIKV